MITKLQKRMLFSLVDREIVRVGQHYDKYFDLAVQKGYTFDQAMDYMSEIYKERSELRQLREIILDENTSD